MPTISYTMLLSNIPVIGGIVRWLKDFFLYLYNLPGLFYEILVIDEGWRLYLQGTLNTIVMTIIALFIGVIIGVILALIKYLHKSTGKLKIAAGICHLYTTIIRGTPVAVQLMIICYMIFKKVDPNLRVFVAGLSFGINSGAYVSEIIRSGIESVDKGQSETGRSLGLNQLQTMRLIVLPQAIKNILPSLFNELIALLKETSVASFISVTDISYAGDLIRAVTFGFEPLLVSAAIYLVLVLLLTQIQKKFERRMARSD